MFRFLKTTLLALIVVGGIWLLLNKDQIEQPQDIIVLAQQKLRAMQAGYDSAAPSVVPPRGFSNNAVAPQHRAPQLAGSGLVDGHTRQPRTSIRVASFRLTGEITEQRGQIADALLMEICQRYDAIAIQSDAKSAGHALAKMVDRLNASNIPGVAAGRRPHYRLLSQVGERAAPRTGLEIIFDDHAVELDESHWYTVNDPDDVFSHEPQVAWFRVKGLPIDEAFTFSLVNLQLDSWRPDRELQYLGELFRAIRQDGRGEDDVIIAGNFNAGDRGLRPSQQKSGLNWVISGTPTDTNQTAQFDNIVFNSAATVEFTGRGGVFDFMKHFNLRLLDAVSVSSHLPVWAEFSLREGDRNGKVARGVLPISRDTKRSR